MSKSSSFDAKAELQNTPEVKKYVAILNDNSGLVKLEKLIDSVPITNRSLYYNSQSEKEKSSTIQPIDRVVSAVKNFKKIIEQLKTNKTKQGLNNLNNNFQNIVVNTIELNMKPEAYKSLQAGLFARIKNTKYGIDKDIVSNIIKPYLEALDKLEKLGITDPNKLKALTEASKPPEPSKEDKSSAERTEADAQGDQPPKEKEDVIALIFNMLYFVGGIVAAVLVVVLFILASFDLLKFNINTITQYVSLLTNPNMYNKDTQDFKALMYYRNSTDTEPYTIFGQQELVKVMFNLATSVIGLLMLQVLILIVMLFIYRVVRGEPLEMGNIDFAKSAKPLGTVLVMVILAFVWTGLYQARFLNKIQPSIIYTHTNIEQVKNYIYDNLTTNEQFLTNLVNGDLNECTKIINQQTNDNRIVRMIYTMSLYNFFKINISENEEAFNTVIRDIFSVTEIRVRAVNPIHYMYYNQNVFLPNLYPVLRPYIYGTNKGISTSARDKIIRLDITQRINETNKRLMTLYKVPERKSQLSTYFIVAFVISLVFLMIVYGLYRENIRNLFGGDVLTKLKEIIASILSSKQTAAEKPAIAQPEVATK